MREVVGSVDVGDCRSRNHVRQLVRRPVEERCRRGACYQVCGVGDRSVGFEIGAKGVDLAKLSDPSRGQRGGGRPDGRLAKEGNGLCGYTHEVDQCVFEGCVEFASLGQRRISR